ncbi:hypothetical protein ABTD22_20565, partial [Acinetobacter baumannii]
SNCVCFSMLFVCVSMTGLRFVRELRWLTEAADSRQNKLSQRLRVCPGGNAFGGSLVGGVVRGLEILRWIHPEFD